MRKLFLFRFFKTQFSINSKRFVSNDFQTENINNGYIPRTLVEYDQQGILLPEYPQNARSLNVSIIGSPNSGKSTLANRLLGRRISSVSSRPHTTRERITGVITKGNCQVVFTDTPGTIAPWRKKHRRLEKSMIMDPMASLWNSDCIIVVHDISNEYHCKSLDEEVMKCLFAFPENEAILVLNKIDRLKKKNFLLPSTVSLTNNYMNDRQITLPIFSKEQRTLRSSMKKLLKEENIMLELDDVLPFVSDEMKDQIINHCHMLDEMKNVLHKKISNYQLLSEGNDNQLKLENSSDNFNELIPSNSSSYYSNKSSLISSDASPYHPTTTTTTTGKLNDLILNEKNLLMKLNDDKNVYLKNVIKNHILKIEKVEERYPSPVAIKEDLMNTQSWNLYYEKWKKLEDLIRIYKKSNGTFGWPYFSQIFMVSSLDSNGVNDLRNYLFLRTKNVKQWQFHRDVRTDQMPHRLTEMCVREKLLEYLPNEIPYQLQIETRSLEIDENDVMRIDVEIICRKRQYKRDISTILNNHGALLHRIGVEAKQELWATFQTKCSLRLQVK
ncbi:hypothetical protein SNEBB_005300 [Seison nebaliae]|nr:hypothetical protein SNEBB_005300 [Seison nebaliae]